MVTDAPYPSFCTALSHGDEGTVGHCSPSFLGIGTGRGRTLLFYFANLVILNAGVAQRLKHRLLHQRAGCRLARPDLKLACSL